MGIITLEAQRLVLPDNEKIQIVTLGPEGTDSKHAAEHFGNRYLSPHGYTWSVILLDSFPRVIEALLTDKNITMALMPVASPSIGQVLYDTRLQIGIPFMADLKPMSLGRNPNGTPGTCGIHVATQPFVEAAINDNLLPTGVIISKHESKVKALMACQKGDTEFCIASTDTMEETEVKILHTFPIISMLWVAVQRKPL